MTGSGSLLETGVNLIVSSVEVLHNTGNLVEEKYLEILEHTNQQLALVWTPMSIFISSLGVLFAVGAIVAGVLLYRQSREFNDKLDKDRTLYKENIDNFLIAQKEILNTQTSKLKDDYDTLISEYKKKLNNASKEAKSDIQKNIDELNKAKLNVGNNIAPIVVRLGPKQIHSKYRAAYNTINTYKRFSTGITMDDPLIPIKCGACGYNFYVDKGDNDTSITSRYKDILYSNMDSQRVACPICGNDCIV